MTPRTFSSFALTSIGWLMILTSGGCTLFYTFLLSEFAGILAIMAPMAGALPFFVGIALASGGRLIGQTPRRRTHARIIMGCGITISLLTIAIARFFTILGAGGSFTEQKIMLIAPPCFALGIIIFLIGNFILKQNYKNDDT